MVEIQINVQNSTVFISKSQDAQNYIVDITKARCFIPTVQDTSRHITVIAINENMTGSVHQ